MKQHVNTYGGMNKDASYDSISSNLYIHAQNIRITTRKGESMGAFTNIKGNEEAFVLSPVGSTNPEIIGYTTIRNRIILFVADDNDADGWIYEVRYDEATRAILPGYPVLLYTGALAFSKANPIKATGRYESDCTQRVYWTDYNNYLRSLNISDPNVLTYPLDQIDIFPNIEYVQPYLTGIAGGGALLSGEYQAAYRLTTTDGKESLISPPSNLIHITSNSETLLQSAQYNGELVAGVNTGKSISITIDTSNYGEYDKIELVMVYHSTLLGSPVVKTIEKQEINNQAEVTFLYTGTEDSAVTIELDTYTIKTNPFKTCKTLAQKDNSLVIANIKGSSISAQDLLANNETFDAKALRYLPSSTSSSPSGAYNTELNRDAHWDPDWHTDKQYKFQENSLRLGGNGPNISYTFHLEPFTVDGTNSPGFANVAPVPDAAHDLQDGPAYGDNNTYPNMASPFISGLLRGYKRGETYRFGIIFYTTKGEATFVEYIGDIKFPDISEQDSVVNNSTYKYFPTSTGVGGDTTAYAMGIQFTLNFLSCPSLLSQIESYQIVRVKREQEDTRRACSGIMKNFWTAPVGSSAPRNYDLRINSSQLVLHLMPYNPNGIGSTTGADIGSNSYNGEFENISTALVYAKASANYEVKGEAVAFYSPEISHNYNNVRISGSNLSASPSLLMTGVYHSTNGKVIIGGIQDLSGVSLAPNCIDYRTTLRSTYPVSFNSVENIKKWDFVQMSVMDHSTTYEDSDATTPMISGFTNTNPITLQTTFHLRNYYAIDDFPDTNASLNDPQPGGLGTSPEFFKGGSALIGKIGTILIDPLDATAVGGGATDWFNNTNIDVLNQSTLNPDSALEAITTPILDLVLPKDEVYGGYTTTALEANVFIPASPVIDKTELNPRVYGGDIFLNMFTLQLSTLEYLETDFFASSSRDYLQEQSETQILVTESLINLDLATGSNIKTNVSFTVGAENRTILRQETGNSNVGVIPYGKSEIMYKYLDVYSRENSDLVFITQSENATNCTVDDIKAYLSNVKKNGEAIDSWAQFPLNDNYDVDDYGPINEIVNWKDRVYFIQDTAFGAYSINRSAITTTTDGVPTELGSGVGFSKHQYYSKENGSIHQWAIKATERGIYIFDAIHRKIHMLAGGVNTLSEVKGMHSWIGELPDAVFLRKENGGDNPILDSGVTIGRNIIDDEVVFTFLSSDEKYSLVLDEGAQQFCAIDTTTPRIYIENGDIIMSPSETSKLENATTLYTHGLGDWGKFYGNVEESSLTFVVNPNADINKLLRTFEFNSIVRDDNKVIDRAQTITAFRIQTEYQDTGKIPFSSGRIKRRFDKWRVKIPRDIITPAKNQRLRSTHFIVSLYFDNTANKELIMNRVISHYDVQMF